MKSSTKVFAWLCYQAIKVATVFTFATMVVLIIVDRFAGSPHIEIGYVVAKQYESEINPTMGRQMQDIKQKDSNHVLTIHDTNGQYLSIPVDAQIYYATEVGQEIKYLAKRGYLTGWYWTKEVIY